MDFSPRALIDKAALAHNLAQVRRHAPKSAIMAVIKADAYGHGVKAAVEALADADGFAVARCDEAFELRKLGVDRPIVVMGGAYNRESVLAAAAQGLCLAVHHPWQLDLLESLPAGSLPTTILKIDSGMHRLGLQPAEVEPALTRLQALGCLGARPLLMTHMANADDRSDPKTDAQWALFQGLVRRFDTGFSAANSAVLMSRPEMQGDWVRPGIMLYGVSPFIDSLGVEVGLKPVMTLQARLIAIKQIKKGETVGYGATWTCPEDMPLGVVGIGYGDGYPRHAPTGTPVLLVDRLVPLVGRVSMDMITLDLRTCPEAQVGDQVTLWGNGLPAERVAAAAGTIAYQLFCNLTNRVRFEIREHGQG